MKIQKIYNINDAEFLEKRKNILQRKIKLDNFNISMGTVTFVVSSGLVGIAKYLESITNGMFSMGDGYISGVSVMAFLGAVYAVTNLIDKNKYQREYESYQNENEITI